MDTKNQNHTMSKFSFERNFYLLLLDIFVFLLTPLASIVIRRGGFESINISNREFQLFIIYLVFVKIAIFYFLKLYSRFWRFAGLNEFSRIISGGFFILVIETITLNINRINFNVLQNIPPFSFPIIDVFLTLSYFGLIRFSFRILNQAKTIGTNGNSKDKKNTIIIGAGSSGLRLLREITDSNISKYYPVAFLDDDPIKLKKYLNGVIVAGDIDFLAQAIEKYSADQIIIAINNLDGTKIKKITEVATPLNISIKTLPHYAEFLDYTFGIKQLRPISVEDLLNRPAKKIDFEKISTEINGKNILVTGAGGSIGSEICRQLIKMGPASLILLGHGENSIFEIQNELFLNQNQVKIKSIIADIRDSKRMKKVFSENRIDLIFHAAAHKHVPLMEENISEAVTNNILGTLNLCELSIKHNVKNLILISSDKAVNPTSTMGVTKRIAELIIKKYALKYKRKFSAVRFGNVLGSRGSVIPIFRKQLEENNHVTVTHPDITRYFMTIPEASGLVIQSSSLSNGGEIFTLDMGEPIKIIDLAKNLILLSGKSLNKVEIRFTGLRPGEKLFEELSLDSEKITKTLNEKIFITKDITNGELDIDKSFGIFITQIEQLVESANEGNKKNIIAQISKLVKEYKPGHIFN